MHTLCDKFQVLLFMSFLHRKAETMHKRKGRAEQICCPCDLRALERNQISDCSYEKEAPSQWRKLVVLRYKGSRAVMNNIFDE